MNVAVLTVAGMLTSLICSFLIFFVHSSQFVLFVNLVARMDARKLGYRNGVFTGEGKGVYAPAFIRNFILNKWSPNFPWMLDPIILLDERILFSDDGGHLLDRPRNSQRSVIILRLAQWVGENKVDSSFVPYKLAQGLGFLYGHSLQPEKHEWEQLFTCATQEIECIRNTIAAEVSLSFFKELNQKRYEEQESGKNGTVIDFVVTADEFKSLKKLPLDLALSLV